MPIKIATFLLISFCMIQADAQTLTNQWFQDFLVNNGTEKFRNILNKKQEHRIQIIYTKIDRDENNNPSFISSYFNVNDQNYFNPASTVKLPLAILSLEKLNELNIPNLNKHSRMAFDSTYSGQTEKITDETSETGYPSIAHFIKKAMIVSDNDAYTRMYEFVGPQKVNERLHEMHYPNVRIMHRFVPMSLEENRHTNAVRFYNDAGEEIYYQAPQHNAGAYDHSRDEHLGKAYMNNQDKIINQPFDFSVKNRISLPELNSILQSVLFPEYVSLNRKFNLTTEDYSFLYQYLSQFPGETNYPKYDSKKFYDTYVKYFFGNKAHQNMPEGVRVFNKVGWAYGFLTDISYVADFKNNIEFMLSATIYVNENETLNDGVYEYEETGLPFLYELGQIIYKHELERNRQYTPDLSAFKVQYDFQEKDERPVITEVEN